MNNQIKKEQRITAVYSDQFCELGAYQASVLIQDAMTELFHQFRCDAIQMRQSHGAVWAVARTKICYDKFPVWMDFIRMTAFPVKVSSVAVHIDVLVETLDGIPLLRCRQELCAIDEKDHKLRRIDTTSFPQNIALQSPVVTTPCRRMKVALGEDYLADCRSIRTSDTDMNHHMNNAAYVRFIMDALPLSFWTAHRVREFDIHYVREGREGEKLQIFCKQEGLELTALVKEGERVLVKAFFQLTSREVDQ